jgi:hypothetical protein
MTDEKIFKIHFGYAPRSKYYNQALELSKFSLKHVQKGEKQAEWNIAYCTEDQIDIMAHLYYFARKIGYPKYEGADLLYLYVYCKKNGNYDYPYASKALKMRVKNAVDNLIKTKGKTHSQIMKHIDEEFIKPIEKDMQEVYDYLIKKGYYSYTDRNTGEIVKAKKFVSEPIPEYREILQFIKNKRYEDAVHVYYNTLKDEFYGNYIKELLYLKRLGHIRFEGRDLIYFRPPSKQDKFINNNLEEYVKCIDIILNNYHESDRKLPIDLLCEYCPTMDDLLLKHKLDYETSIYYEDHRLRKRRNNIILNPNDTKFDNCEYGRFFKQYPDPIRNCNIIEYPEDKRFSGYWTTLNENYYINEVINKGFSLRSIQIYYPKDLNFRRKQPREPSFKTINSINSLISENYGTNGIRYTGDTHKIDFTNFYEIDLIRYNYDKANFICNPLCELATEILRDAENLLRKNHNLPCIGEGWISETQLYNLVKSYFTDTVHHAMPNWLKPQHLDIFIPSENIAIEYHGLQHFEPVDFFGGKDSLKDVQFRDKRKMSKCKMNRVELIIWKYDTEINDNNLKKILAQYNVNLEAV